MIREPQETPMSSIELDDMTKKEFEDWVCIDKSHDDPETALRRCWEKLPVTMSFVEFKERMTRRNSEDIDWTSWLSTMHTLWLVSGYASQALYYKEPLTLILKWLLR